MQKYISKMREHVILTSTLTNYDAMPHCQIYNAHGKTETRKSI